MNSLKADFEVEDMAHTLEVTPSGFYAHQQKPHRPRRQQDQALLQKIKPIFKDSRKTYGSPRLHASLRKAGERCGKNRVARIMRENNMKAQQKRRFVPRTTQSDHDHPIAPNWLAKVPRPDKPDQVWVVDITYIETAEGWIYLAVILDVCSRKVVGWAMGISFGNHVGDSSPEPGAKRALSGSGTFTPFRSRSSVCQWRVSSVIDHV